jgi:predicted metal-dependent peptidase
MWAIRIIEVPDLATRPDMGGSPIAVDKHWRLYFDPAVILSWELDVVTGVLAHELHHLLRKHAERAMTIGITPQSFRLWNIAADLEINDDLSREFKLPAGGVHPKQFGFPTDLSAEEYYRLLQQQQQQQSDQPDNQPQPTSGQGSGVDGVPKEWEQGDGDGTNRDAPPITQAEGSAIIKITAEQIQKSVGTAPAYLRKWAQKTLTKVIDWRAVLAASVRASASTVRGRQDYSYRYRSRRQGHRRDIILPAP